MALPSWKIVSQILTKLNVVLPYGSAIVLLGIYPMDLKMSVCVCVCLCVCVCVCIQQKNFCSKFIHNLQKLEATKITFKQSVIRPYHVILLSNKKKQNCRDSTQISSTKQYKDNPAQVWIVDRDKQVKHRIFRAVKLFCVTLQWWKTLDLSGFLSYKFPIPSHCPFIHCVIGMLHSFLFVVAIEMFLSYVYSPQFFITFRKIYNPIFMT